jgi:histidinol phosphatase-like enzyme
MSRSTAVFLDLHGTLGDQGPHGIDGFTLYPCAVDAIRLLNAARLLAIVVTNQSRIARGQFTSDDFETFAGRLREQLQSHGATLAAV